MHSLSEWAWPAVIFLLMGFACSWRLVTGFRSGVMVEVAVRGRIVTANRAINPVGFWIMVVFYSVFLLFSVIMIAGIAFILLHR